MRIEKIDYGYRLIRENGQALDLTFLETHILTEYFRKEGWRSEIECEIDFVEDSISFDEISRTEFVEDVLEALNERYENGYSFDDQTIHDKVEECATECGIWRDEE